MQKTKKATGATLTGFMKITSKGFGVVKEKDGERDVFVQKDYLNTALHGDIVTVRITGTFKADLEGQVTTIQSRAKDGHMGILEKTEAGFRVLPSDSRMYTPITIPRDGMNNAKPGEKVFVKITKWEANEIPEGEIIKVLGQPFTQDAEMEGIALERGFSSTFPEAVERESESLYKNTSIEDEAKHRRDFRDVPTFTIDPADAKDFDDALSVRVVDERTVEVGVHIADVSFYVRPGTRLDEEAFRRSTSIYLVDRTVPMLPEALSNDLCSLKPDVPRLTASAVFQIRDTGEIVDEWYGRTIIHSKKRFTYEEAEKVRTGELDGPFQEEIQVLAALAKKLNAERVKKGSINFEQDEVKFTLDDSGYPVDIKRKVRLESHKLIEEWMLLANKKIAEYMSDEKRSPFFIYRVHDAPDHEKISDLLAFLKGIGHPARVTSKKISGHMLQDILNDVEGTPERDLVNTTIIRSMAKAIYSIKNIGHFGLAFDYYTHFTSPIRRYPDIMVHRFLFGEINTAKPTALPDLVHAASYTSDREKNAADAERASVKYAQVAYMARHIGETRDGIITGVTENGIFVEEKKSKADGFIPLRLLGNDMFRYDKKTLSLRGGKTKKQFRIGDPLTIIITKADRERGMIDFSLAGYEDTKGK